MPDLQSRRYLISGRVQGVGFRWFVEREAALIGVTGWVRNTENGDVEVMATGTHEQAAGGPASGTRGSRPRISGAAAGVAIVSHRRSLVAHGPAPQL